MTVSYLINSCGLSLQSALSTAKKKINMKATEKPDSVLIFFRSHGCTDTQVAKLITKCPSLLQSSLENTIKPKIEYLQAVGYSGADLANLASSAPYVLLPSLENTLKPNFSILATIFGTKEQIATAVRRNNRLIRTNLETSFLPNVRTLQSYGVPLSNISRLAMLYPRALTQAPGQFVMSVETIKEIGFSLLSMMFVHGVYVLSGTKPSTWKRKVDVYKGFGCSEGEVMSALMIQPTCMLLADERIRRSMDFFVKKMCWEPSSVLVQPRLLCFSLEKWVIPRFSVLSVLQSKGLVSSKLGLCSLLNYSEKDFLDKYVTRYADQAPEVVEAYNS